ncbi:MAG: PASTA domain-containing protein [Tidjanibacter sp.]|nr:PASTA domain-containing protein [Tidjanibacter sp.]
MKDSNIKPKSPHQPDKTEPLRRIVVRNIILAVSLLIIGVVTVEIGLNIFTRHGVNKDVPNFIGASLGDAQHAARRKHLEIIVNDSLYVPMYAGGVVLEQRPSAGRKKVKSGRKIYVTVNAMEQRREVVPYVAGFSLRQARSNLDKAGFEIERIEYVGDMAQNYVIEQRYNGQAIGEGDRISAPVGSGVTLIVGRAGVYSETVPNLIGMTLRQAKSAIWDKGFNIGNIEFKGIDNLGEQNAARVVGQSPLSDQTFTLGGNISFTMEVSDK